MVRKNFILTALDNVLPTWENSQERQAALRKDTLAMTRSSRLLRHLILLPCPLLALLNGLITNDKFCMSRVSPSRVRWVRRAPLRRAPPAMTDDLHNDSDHCGGSHDTPVAHPASVPGGRGRRAAMGSGRPTRAPLASAPRPPSHLGAAVEPTTGGGLR